MRAAGGALVTALCAVGLAVAGASSEDLASQVRATEAAFAKTMADRDHAAFLTFLSEEAVFVGPSRVLRGKKAVGEGWKPFYEGAEPPFSWKPDRVEVIESGTLALSSGPVFDPQGRRVGTFNSVWRREKKGWKIVLDNGCPPCEQPAADEPKTSGN
jgi:ketosteroid isomerase-like protein